MYSSQFHNFVFYPMCAWRVIFGPLNPYLSAIASLSYNLFSSWVFVALTELAVIKALMIYKFSMIAGMDDISIGRFLLLVNLCYTFLSQIGRFFVGSMFESIEFQLLSGNYHQLGRKK